MIARVLGDARNPFFLPARESAREQRGFGPRVLGPDHRGLASAHLIGKTATPERLDGKGLGVEAGGSFEALVLGPSAACMVEQGRGWPSADERDEQREQERGYKPGWAKHVWAARQNST